jgi:hypothetical protein
MPMTPGISPLPWSKGSQLAWQSSEADKHLDSRAGGLGANPLQACDLGQVTLCADLSLPGMFVQGLNESKL